MNNYGERLQRAMTEKGIDQKTLAGMLSTAQASISRIINGKQFLDFDLAIRVCEILGVSLDWLAYGREAPREAAYYRNPERQRIEYLMSILQESDYNAVIVAMEEIIEIRMGKQGRVAIDESKNPEEAAG